MISRSQSEQLKGLSIILVMAGHLITIHKLSLPQEFRFLATFSVDVFLILSGYGLTKSFVSKGLDGFFSKRLLNVALPFIVANIFIYAFYGYKIYDFTSFVRTITFNMLDLKLDGTMWFIYFIALWYLLFWVIFSLPTNNKAKSLLSICVAFLIYFFANKIPYPILSSQFALHAFSFPIGILIAIYNKDKPLKNTYLASLFSMLFLICYYSIFQKFTINNYIMCCIFYGLAITFSIPILDVKSNILEWFGKYSYEAYLVEGILFRFSYSESQIINAILFFLVTMTLAIILQVIHKNIFKILFKRLSA